MDRKLRLATIAAVVVGALAVGSYAIASALWTPHNPPNSRDFRAEMLGYQETPAVSTTGFGLFKAKLLEHETDKLHFVLTYSGLEGGDTLFAHVHFGYRGSAGGVSFFLCGGNTKPDPCPNVAGTVEGDITPADVVGPSGQGIEPGSFSEIVQAMRAGTAYVNIHTTRWPSGEIRGQINNDSQKQFQG